jgi:3-methylfumaryl-CoA hydratase
VSELLTPGPAEALAGLLGVPLPDLAGAGLPLGWHWLYLLDRPAQADLGPDGHPVRGSVPVPPGPGLRRMWAGGEIRLESPLRIGEPAVRRTTVLSTQDKQGRTGRLTFVAVGHEISQGGRIAVRERQDLVYRAPAPLDPGPAGAPVPMAAGEWSIDVTPTLLFRFSALTYNAHRIHYDRPYAQEVEGYPGLLTHGPLQALAMAEAARARYGLGEARTTFEYRLVAPLFDHQGLVVRASAADGGIETMARDMTGRLTARGAITGQAGTSGSRPW